MQEIGSSFLFSDSKGAPLPHSFSSFIFVAFFEVLISLFGKCPSPISLFLNLTGCNISPPHSVQIFSQILLLSLQAKAQFRACWSRSLPCLGLSYLSVFSWYNTETNSPGRAPSYIARVPPTWRLLLSKPDFPLLPLSFRLLRF